MNISPTTRQALEALVDGKTEPADFAEWLITADEAPGLFDDEVKALRMLRLLSIEVGEGLRPLDELILESERLVASAPIDNSVGSTNTFETVVALTRLVTIETGL